MLTTALLAAALASGLNGAPELRRAYDAIFDARFDDLPALLAAACPPAPAEACQLMEVVGLWWQIQLGQQDGTQDARFERRVNAAIASAEAWTTREPARAEAWFYLGGAYGARAQWRGLRGEPLAAARDGKRIKEALEKALALDPELHDAYFGIGLYRYYADIAPAIARMLRWLFLLPGGDREEGLEQMLRARAQGELLVGEADYQLGLLYLWYEKRPDRALELMRTLHERHPRNHAFLVAVAESLEQLGMRDDAMRTYRDVLAPMAPGDRSPIADRARAGLRRLGVRVR